MRSFIFAPVLALVVGCAEQPEAPSFPAECAVYHNHHFASPFTGQWHYDVTPNYTTPSGIRVVTSGQHVDLDALERQVDEAEACLRNAFGDTPVVTPADMASSMGCDSPTFPMPIMRECLVVKIADNWIPSQISAQQLLPVPANVKGCTDKGICLNPDGTPIANCECHWRGGIQDNSVIVTTPTQYVFKDPLIRLVTGCNNPWVGKLAACAAPSVPPSAP